MFRRRDRRSPSTPDSTRCSPTRASLPPLSDKRGKPKPRHKTAKQKSDSNPLRHYYSIEDEEDDSEEVGEERAKDRKMLKKFGDESSESKDSGEDDDDVESGDSEDSSDTGSEEEDGDDVYLEDEEDDNAVGVESVPVIEEETHRLATC